jgi:acetyl/propionyl-CoA carboxylase alpha subunit
LKSSFEASSHPKGAVVAPMAGLVIKVLVENGAQVYEGQPILVLEAMKMEVHSQILYKFHLRVLVTLDLHFFLSMLHFYAACC